MDGYGGSLRGRCRLALEIAGAIRDAAPELALGIQLSVDEHLEGLGITPAETEEQLAILSERPGADTPGLFRFVAMTAIVARPAHLFATCNGHVTDLDKAGS